MQAPPSFLKDTIIKIFKIKKKMKETDDDLETASNKIKLLYFLFKAKNYGNKNKAAKKIQKMFKVWKKKQDKED